MICHDLSEDTQGVSFIICPSVAVMLLLGSFFRSPVDLVPASLVCASSGSVGFSGSMIWVEPKGALEIKAWG